MIGTFVARACLGAALAIVLAGPALAGRGVKIDELQYNAPAPCSLGAAVCEGYNISDSGIFQTAYIYREGIVSFDQLLPSTATHTDIASLGGGTWFAAGFRSDASYNVGVYVARPFDFNDTRSIGFNFYTGDRAIYPQTDSEGFPTEPDFPNMQVFLTSQGGFVDNPDDPGSYGQWASFYSEIGYDTGWKPAPGSIIGFNTPWGGKAVRSIGGLKVGDGGGDTDFTASFGHYGAGTEGYYDTVCGPTYVDENGVEQQDCYEEYVPGDPPSRQGFTGFTPLYDAAQAAVPEPATWGMMLAGFGLIGGAMRRRAGRALAA